MVAINTPSLTKIRLLNEKQVWTVSNIDEGLESLFIILGEDVVNFPLHGTVSMHNFIIWAKENLHSFIMEPLHTAPVTVKYGLTAFINVGPIVFEELCSEAGWQTCSINGTRYLQTLQKKAIIRAKVKACVRNLKH